MPRRSRQMIHGPFIAHPQTFRTTGSSAGVHIRSEMERLPRPFVGQFREFVYVSNGSGPGISRFGVPGPISPAPVDNGCQENCL